MFDLSNDELRARLSERSTSELVDMLVECADRDEEMRRRLIDRTVPDSQLGDLTASIAKRIERLWRAASHAPVYAHSRAAADEVDSIHTSIACLADRGRPEAAARLMERLLDEIEKRAPELGDGGGHIFGEAQWLIREWGRLWARIEPRDVRSLARTVFNHVQDNVHGAKDDLVTAFKDALGREGMEELKALLSAWADEVRARADRDESARPGMDLRHAESALRDIADLSDDVDGFIALCRSQGRLTISAADIAQKLLDAGRAEEALAFFEEHVGSATREPETSLAELKSHILIALGRTGEAGHVLWKAFKETLCSSLLEQALELSPPEQRDALTEEAVHVAEEYHFAERALSFLVGHDSLDRAAALVDHRSHEMTGTMYPQLAEAARRLASDHPRQSWSLLRILTDDILMTGRSKAYPHAARYVRDMKQRAREGGFTPDHEAYVADLGAAHKRKRSFWAHFEPAT